MSLLLEGKRAFVSGGTRGIGAAICEIFAREGADVAFNYNSRDDLAEEIRKKIEAYGRKALSYKISVTDRLGLKRLTREIVEKWQGIDILVNNAAINRGDNFATTTDRAWDEVINTTSAAFSRTNQFINNDRQRKGSILNIHLLAPFERLPYCGHYANIQSGDDWIHQVPSREAGTFGVKVNAIAAGIFDTELAQV